MANRWLGWLLGRGVLGQGGPAGKSYRWTAPTYRLDAAGRAYNIPAVTGSELFTNPGFASDTAWTKGAGWSIGSGVASRSGTAAQSNLTQSPAIDRYKLYRLIYTLTALSAGSNLGLVQGSGVGQRRTALGTYTAWARLGQATTYGFQAVANSVLSIDNASLYAVDMDTALAMINVTEEVDRVGVAFETAPGDDAMMLIMCAGAANSLYNCVVAALLQNTDGNYRVRLFKVVDGVPSATLGSDGTITFVAGAKLEIRRDGTTYTAYYNGATTAATGTITDASIVNNTYHGFCILGSTYRTSGFWLNGRRVPFRNPIRLVPLVSDGFSTPGTTDGLGHAGASGGAGLTWVDSDSDAFGTSVGAVTNRDVSGSSVGEYYLVESGQRDVDARVNLTWANGTGGVMVRRLNGNYYVRGVHNGTHAQIVKMTGSLSTVMSEPATHVAGAEIRLRVRGDKFQLFYNGAAVGAEQTISDADLQTGTGVGLGATGTGGNEFDNFVCYAS